MPQTFKLFGGKLRAIIYQGNYSGFYTPGLIFGQTLFTLVLYISFWIYSAIQMLSRSSNSMQK